jgi:CTP-dependent riboflavin kinase
MHYSKNFSKMTHSHLYCIHHSPGVVVGPEQKEKNAPAYAKQKTFSNDFKSLIPCFIIIPKKTVLRHVFGIFIDLEIKSLTSCNRKTAYALV